MFLFETCIFTRIMSTPGKLKKVYFHCKISIVINSTVFHEICPLKSHQITIFNGRIMLNHNFPLDSHFYSRQAAESLMGKLEANPCEKILQIPVFDRWITNKSPFLLVPMVFHWFHQVFPSNPMKSRVVTMKSALFMSRYPSFS